MQKTRHNYQSWYYKTERCRLYFISYITILVQEMKRRKFNSFLMEYYSTMDWFIDVLHPTVDHWYKILFIYFHSFVHSFVHLFSFSRSFIHSISSYIIEYDVLVWLPHNIQYTVRVYVHVSYRIYRTNQYVRMNEYVQLYRTVNPVRSLKSGWLARATRATLSLSSL